MDPSLTPEELVNLVKQTQVTYNPLDDIYKIMKLGHIIYESNKYHEWQECNDLYESLIVELDNNIQDFNYNKEELSNKIEGFISQNLYPPGTKHELLEYLRTIYVTQKDFNYSTVRTSDSIKAREYLEFMSILRSVIDNVYSKYIPRWEEINDKFDRVNSELEKKFGHVEVQEEFKDFTNKISGLMDEVDEVFKPFNKYTSDYINKGHLERDYKMCFNVVMAKNNIDSITEDLLKSSIYLTNVQLHKLNISLKMTQHKLSSIVFQQI